MHHKIKRLTEAAGAIIMAFVALLIFTLIILIGIFWNAILAILIGGVIGILLVRELLE